MRLRKVPKPVGGWASRSTSSLRRDDLVAGLAQGLGETLVLGGDGSERALGVQQPLVQGTGTAWRVGEPPTQICDLGLQEGDLVQQLGSGRSLFGT